MRILLVARTGARWALPGGRQKENEVLPDTARRELLEETRLQATGVSYLFEFGGARTRHHVFVANIADDAHAMPDNEISRCQWVHITDVARLTTSISTKGIVDILQMVASSRHRGESPRSRRQKAMAFIDNVRRALENDGHLISRTNGRAI
jgi:8-oxo-dGTP diphosphatase